MKGATYIVGIVAASLIASSQAVSNAQPGNRPPPKPRTYKVTVSPAAVPDEALKYSFLVDSMDQIEGNAAPFYMRAIILYQRGPETAKDDEVFGEFLEKQFDARPDPDLRKRLAKYNSSLDQIRMGALRDTCRWEQPFREQGINTLLPELSQVRALVRLVAVQARVQIADKQYDAALRTLRTGFTMARHVNEQPVLIQSLVAAACAAQTFGVIRDLSQQPDAPNLYWALTSLPHPLLDQRQTMLWEKNFLYFSFPQLKSAARNAVSAAEWQKVWEDLTTLGGSDQAASAKMLFMAGAFRDYAKAKKYLLSTGMPAEQVEKMSVVQAVGIYFVHTYDKVGDALWKWWLLPYPQAREGLDRFDAEFRKLRAEDPFNPIFMVLPAVNRAYARLASLDRDMAAAQCVEAVRAYAAAHDGQLPQALDMMSDTPAPLDPTTGKPFVYRVNGKTATLESPPTGASPTEGMRYEITIR